MQDNSDPPAQQYRTVFTYTSIATVEVKSEPMPLFVPQKQATRPVYDDNVNPDDCWSVNDDGFGTIKYDTSRKHSYKGYLQAVACAVKTPALRNSTIGVIRLQQTPSRQPHLRTSRRCNYVHVDGLPVWLANPVGPFTSLKQQEREMAYAFREAEALYVLFRFRDYALNASRCSGTHGSWTRSDDYDWAPNTRMSRAEDAWTRMMSLEDLSVPNHIQNLIIDGRPAVLAIAEGDDRVYTSYAAAVRPGNVGVRELGPMSTQHIPPQMTVSLSNNRFPSLTRVITIHGCNYPVDETNYRALKALLDWEPTIKPLKKFKNATVAYLPSVLSTSRDTAQLRSVILAMLAIAGIEPNPGPPKQRYQEPLSQRQENRLSQNLSALHLEPARRHGNPRIVMPMLRHDMSDRNLQDLLVCVDYARTGHCVNRGRCMYHHLNLPEVPREAEDPILVNDEDDEEDEEDGESDDEHDALDFEEQGIPGPVEGNEDEIPNPEAVPDEEEIPWQFEVFTDEIPNGFVGHSDWKRYTFRWMLVFAALTIWGVMLYNEWTHYRLRVQGWVDTDHGLCTKWSTIPWITSGIGHWSWFYYPTFSIVDVPFMIRLNNIFGTNWWLLSPDGYASPFECIPTGSIVSWFLPLVFVYYLLLTVRFNEWARFFSKFGTIMCTFSVNLTGKDVRLAHLEIRDWETDKRFVTMRLKDPKYRSVPVTARMKVIVRFLFLAFSLTPLARPGSSDYTEDFVVDWALFEHLTAPQFMHFDIMDEFVRAKLAVGIKTFHDLAFDRSHVVAHNLVMQTTALFAEHYWRYQQQVAGPLNVHSLLALRW